MDTGCGIIPTELYDSLKNIAVPWKHAQKTSVEYVPLLKKYGAISSSDIFVGLISRSSSKLQCPVVYLQRVSEDNSNGRKYDRYEAFFTANMGQYSPVCAYMKKNRESDECNRCLGIDEIVADFLMRENSDMRTQDEFRALAPDGDINEDVSGFSVHLYDNNPDKLYARYVCEITGYTEIAVPFKFNGKVRGIFFSGQFILDEVLKQTPELFMNKLEKLKGKYDGDYNNSQFLRTSDEYNEWITRNIISEKGLQGIIRDLFESLSGIKGELHKMLIAEVKHKIDRAHFAAYDTISSIDMGKNIDRGNYYNPCSETMAEIFKTAGRAFDNICVELHCSLAVYLCKEIRILDDEPIYLSRATSGIDGQNNLPKMIAVDGKNFYIVPDEIEEYTNRSNWVKFTLRKTDDYIWNIQPSASVTTDYPVVTYIEKSTMERCWRGKYNDYIHEIVEYFEKTVCDLANFTRSLGVEIVARFTAMRLASFTAVTRHEIGQKTAAMAAQFDIIEEKQKTSFVRDKGVYELKKYFFDDFLFNIKSHVSTVSIISDASRYIAGVPTPDSEFFDPYRSFLYKWIHIFKNWEDKYKIKVNYPTIPYLPTKMYGNVGQIEQVAFNLTGNAIKYSHIGTRTLIDCRPDKKNEWYIFETLNFAAPINEEMQKVIFYYGQRGDESNKTGGDGLGLYIARDIALKHGGCLTLRPTAAKAISPYNIPLLYMYRHFIPDEWKSNNEMRKHSLDDDNPLTAQAIEEEIAKLMTMNIDEFVRDYLKTESIDVMEIFNYYLHSNYQSSVFDFVVQKNKVKRWKLKDSSQFFREIQIPTAAINFYMKIPYKAFEEEDE